MPKGTVKGGSSTQAAIISEGSSQWHCGIPPRGRKRSGSSTTSAAVDFWSSGIYSKVSAVDENEVNEAFEILLEEIEAVADARPRADAGHRASELRVQG
ncbi:protein of unknown function [Candidatus Bipolaricaulis anaerobius]|uniref:Uncharacterized protein n=1 Tax=Candidatus Bipolaricaulis anaerobius TaxID=2026885 RepID=A0A2X3K5U7_9BACT|nr:protein of unknown function [Candidatus Bipolaricaulis anaerobius]